MSFRRVVIFLYLLFHISVLYAQHPALKFRHLSDEQGLSNTTVNKVTQDYLGFIWIATTDGLNRYDGYHFEIFRNDAPNINSLSSNYINTIFEDHARQLWIGTNNGLNKFDRSKRTFARFQHEDSNPNSISNNRVTNITEDRFGKLWVSTAGGGINVLNTDRTMFQHYRHSGKALILSNDSVNTLCADKKGRIWAGTVNGLELFDEITNTFRPFKNLFNTIRFDKISVVDIKEKDDRLWVGSQLDGLFFIDLHNGSTMHFTHNETEPASLGSDLIKDILIDKSGKIWVGCTNGGLNLYNAASHSFQHYKREPENNFSLSQLSVFAIFEDRQQNLWVGCPRGGLNLYMPLANKFKLFRQNASGTGLSYDDVRSFVQDQDQTIWIGTDGGGISVFRQDGTFIKKFRNDPKNPNSLSSDAILNIYKDRKANIWVSTYGGGMNRYDRKTQLFRSFKHVDGNPHSISSNYVTKVLRDSNANIWVATSDGLNLFDDNKEEFKIVDDNKQNVDKCWGRDIIDIEEDRCGNVWILALDGGVNRYELKTGKFSHYMISSSDNKDLSIGFTDSKNRFWLGKKGLYRYDNKKDSFIRYPDKAGLIEEYIKGIEEDGRGNLWLATSKGVTRLNPDAGDYTKFNTGDGLQGMEFEVKSCLKAADGEIYFGGVNGFNAFYPNKIHTNKYDAPVYITALDIFNKPANVGAPGSPLDKDISLIDKIRLSPNQTSITLSFTALNYVVSENNKYLYKLDGFDRSWINSGTIPSAIYTNLDPATYLFHVRATNNDGFKSTYERTLTIVVMPPIYATWWFRLSTLLLIGFIAYQIIKFRHRLVIKAIEDEKNEKMHQLQLQFFTNISHEFRTPLSLIIGLLERFKLNDTSKSLSSYYQTLDRNVNRLMNLINELMDFNKVTSGAMKLKVRPIDLNDFIQNIVEDFKDISQLKTLTLTIYDSDKLKHAWIDPKILEKILLNLINNSFKYTSAQAQIAVEAFMSKDWLKPKFENSLIIKNNQKTPAYFYIQVTDNGIGISKTAIAHLFERYYRVNASQLGSGVGLAFVKSLTQLHKGEIHVYSEVQKGTQFIIALPLGKDIYKSDEILPDGIEDSGLSFESIIMSHEVINQTDIPEQSVIEPTDGHTNERILLVDDNDELREFYKQSLMTFYIILEAANGEDGMEIAQRESPDLIISDVMMPVMDGNAFCRAVKNDLETSHIPFIMLTAKYGQDSQIEGVESGADIYLSKPVSLKLLQLSVRNILDQKRKLKDFYIKDYYAEAKDLANTARDKEFLEKLVAIIEKNIINPELDLDFICLDIGMSHSKLYSKVKNITGQTVVEFIRSYRLKKAIQIITNQDVSLNEVAYRVGIQTQSHFTKAFKKEFGKTPSQFLLEIKRTAH